jgi:RES domain-containing protein
MIVYRICNEIFNTDISGTGAKLYGGRWNSKGTPMLYASCHISLSVLELLVHNHFQDFAVPLSILKIQLPKIETVNEIKTSKLKPNWIDDVGYTNFMGNEFINSNTDLYIKIPSAVITDECNVLVNPLHHDFKKVKIIETSTFKTDKRLFSL